jgi:hypothetical protein
VLAEPNRFIRKRRIHNLSISRCPDKVKRLAAKNDPSEITLRYLTGQAPLE